MSKYLCWNCGLWQGDEQDDLESSKLCPACKKAMAEVVHGTNLTGTTHHEEEGCP